MGFEQNVAIFILYYSYNIDKEAKYSIKSSDSSKGQQSDYFFYRNSLLVAKFSSAAMFAVGRGQRSSDRHRFRGFPFSGKRNKLRASEKVRPL
jgi:hypothetical protein